MKFTGRWPNSANNTRAERTNTMCFDFLESHNEGAKHVLTKREAFCHKGNIVVLYSLVIIVNESFGLRWTRLNAKALIR